MQCGDLYPGGRVRPALHQPRLRGLHGEPHVRGGLGGPAQPHRCLPAALPAFPRGRQDPPPGTVQYSIFTLLKKLVAKVIDTINNNGL